jgi:hypothetical protein
MLQSNYCWRSVRRATLADNFRFLRAGPPKPALSSLRQENDKSAQRDANRFLVLEKFYGRDFPYTLRFGRGKFRPIVAPPQF